MLPDYTVIFSAVLTDASGAPVPLAQPIPPMYITLALPADDPGNIPATVRFALEDLGNSLRLNRPDNGKLAAPIITAISAHKASTQQQEEK